MFTDDLEGLEFETLHTIAILAMERYARDGSGWVFAERAISAYYEKERDACDFDSSLLCEILDGLAMLIKTQRRDILRTPCYLKFLEVAEFKGYTVGAVV